jgi:hypothetical protein
MRLSLSPHPQLSIIAPFNIGGSFKLTEHLNLLFTGGRDIYGDTKATLYLGLQILTKKSDD